MTEKGKLQKISEDFLQKCIPRFSIPHPIVIEYILQTNADTSRKCIPENIQSLLRKSPIYEFQVTQNPRNHSTTSRTRIYEFEVAQ